MLFVLNDSRFGSLCGGTSILSLVFWVLLAVIYLLWSHGHISALPRFEHKNAFGVMVLNAMSYLIILTQYKYIIMPTI